MYRILLHIVFILAVPILLSAQDSKTDSLRTHINPAILEPETVQSISTLAERLVQHGRMDEAREWLRLGYEVAEMINDREGKFKILIEFGNLYLNRQMPDSASIMLQQAELNVSTPSERNQLYNLQGVAFNLDGKYILALEQYDRAIALADSLNDRRQVAILNANKAGVHTSLGEHTEALRAYYDGLEFAEQERDSIFIAIASNNVGREFEVVGNYEQAEYFLLRAEMMSRAVGHMVNLRRTLLNLGNLYSVLGEYEKSESYFNESLELANEAGDPLAQIRIYYNMGILEGRRGNVNEAQRLLQFALDESRRINNLEGEFRSASGLGNLEMERGNYAQAIRWYARANQLTDGDLNNPLRLQSYENLYRAYREAGNLAESLKWLEMRNELNDSLTSSEKSRLLAEYETLFNLKRTEQQSEIFRAREQEAQSRLQLQKWFIIFSVGGASVLLIAALILIRSNTKRQEMNEALKVTNDQLSEMNEMVQNQNGELEQLNEIKSKLFAIIAHDLRGPLSSLQSLLYLIREHDLSESEMNEISVTLERNLQENASMMDNLLAWAQAQMNGIHLNTRNFILLQGVKSVTDQIKFQAEKKGVSLKVDVPDEIEVTADYDMIKLVIRNIIANAIKFSKPKDTITIKADQVNEMAEVKIIDQGIGIKKEDQNKLFSNEHFTKRGTDNEKGSGLGLMLCKEFIEKHGGKLWFESEPGEGTTFIFTIPLCQEDSGQEGDGVSVMENIDQD
jgi:two-component system, sensor histidine kinase and response regulator